MFWIASIVYILVLIAVVFFDLKYYIIPDWIILPSIGLALLYCVISRVEWTDILLRIAMSGGMFLIAGLVTSFILKKETIGGGDIKLITAVGLYMGWQDGLLIIFLSAVTALASVLALTALKKQKLDERIPFGFYIAVCGIFVEAVSLFGRQV